MSSFEHVHDLMVEIGELMDLPQVTEYAEQRAWLLVTADGPVALDLDEAGDRLLLSTGLGVPAPAARDEIYEALLEHNDRQPPLGGVRAGLDGLDGEILLMAEQRVTGLGVSGIAAMLAELLANARRWRERLSAPGDRGTGTMLQGLPGEMIRV